MKWILPLAYIGTVFAANWAITTFGFVPVGFGLLAPAGVYFAGMAFTLRDWTQQAFDHRMALVCILVGTLCSALISPTLALASSAAFFSSEMLDLLVFTVLHRRHYLLAIICSNAMGLVIDSLIFLQLAFGSTEYWLGQVVGKTSMTLLAVAMILFVRYLGRPIPVRAS